jgi:hypothetical protein
MNSKRFLWTWSDWPADRNMSVGTPVGSSMKAHLWKPSQKFYHFCYYVILSHLIVFCTFFFPSLCHSPWKPPKIKLKHSLGLFRLYNPKIFRQFRIIQFETSQTGWTVVFHPRFGRFCGVFNAFLVGWSIENVSFDCIYSLG